MSEAPGRLGPTVVIDEARARRNIARMADKARACGVTFRPHFKTHRSRAVAGWLRDAGATTATVSSTAMAAYFITDGWTDLTLAVPAHPGEAARYGELAAAGARLGLLVDHPDAVAALDAALTSSHPAWLKIDVGYGRAGVRWDDPDAIAGLVRALAAARRLEPAGLLTHAGQSYRADGPDAVRRTHADQITRLGEASTAVGHAVPAVSLGDTPCCSLADDFPGVDEIRPGNFVTYDLMQLALGACDDDDLALAVACPVISVRPRDGRAVIHGGAVHFGRDVARPPEGGAVHALARGADGRLDAGLALTELSQEHGVVEGDPERIAALKPGDVVEFVPAHACMTRGAEGRTVTRDGRPLDRAAAEG